ncbi:unnamed protein product [Moneuplotes crassus]|uniref:Uncharacterized protein n=1 Tax=Euplotes crassus TaxID=5936 RepID=A0AAD1XC25_EUPCR|nr:unnamed protein product [Moneuplotes crassus]
MDVKMYEKNNSSSLVGPARTKDYSSKKSPNNAKRNLSMGSNMTYDERKSLETKMNLIKQSNASQYTGFRNPRYKLRSLMTKGRRSASRRKSSNSKKRAHKQKITSHYKQKFPLDNKMRKASEKKRQLQMRARLAKKLSGIKSNDDYKQEEEEEDIPTNEAADESCEYNIPEPGEKIDFNQPREKEDEEVISNNPEDCKYTIFSGEGEILGTAGETQNHDTKSKKMSSSELIQHLTKENKSLKEYIKKILKSFQKFKHNQSITVEKDSIKISSK